MENIHETTLKRKIHETARKRTRINTKILCSFVFIFVFFSVGAASAATLYFSPSSGSFNIGEQFFVSVYVSSAEQAMNAASGIVSFPTDKLQVISLSKAGTIFNLWVQEPSFSNSAGTINFEGIVLNPGFTGTAGKIIIINFRVKKEGSAFLNFSSGSVLANDGRGTNILTSMGSANYFLQTTTATPPTEAAPPSEEEIIPSATSGVPLTPKASSLTHPESEKWYSNNDPEFTWQLPPDVTKVSYAIDQSPTTNPKFIAETLIKKISLPDLKDGTWYFHINFKNQYGWGKIVHRKVLIDTVSPLLFEIQVQKEDPTDPQPILLFETRDELSGLDYYQIKIGAGDIFPVTKEITKSNPYQLPYQAPGQYPIEVKALDKAGNFFLATTQVEISAIETPIITKYPKRLNLGETLNLEGKSLSDVTILVFIQQKGKEPIIGETKANGDGFWQFSYSKTLEKGEYKAWVQAKDKRGALSLASKTISFEVGLPLFLKFGKIAIDYFTVVITLLVLIAGAFLIIFYAWYRISLWRRKIRTETKEVTQIVSQAFRALREEVQEQIEYLDGKAGLTESEEKVRNKLKEALDISEKFIDKELQDIEKELE